MNAPRTDYEAMAGRYDRGRSLHEAGLLEWRRVLGDYLPPADESPVLDLGAGTGIFALLLSSWFACDVVAVEPSEGMRTEGIAKSDGSRVQWMDGSAERIPLHDDSCGAAWLSVSLHHFENLEASVAEIRRVLCPGEPVLIRGLFGGRSERITWVRFFPEAARLSDERHPTVETVAAAFEKAHFKVERLEPIPQTTAATRNEYVERIGVRADSTLAILDDALFEAGEERLKAWALEEPDREVFDHLDLLVLR